MVQITGNLKVKIPDANSDTVDGTIKLDEQVKPEVFGFVGECRLIESTSSVLELSIPQSYFTTTVSLDDMKIISVEASYVVCVCLDVLIVAKQACAIVFNTVLLCLVVSRTH